MKKTIKTNHGEIKTPAFMPDATYGSIKTVSFNDVKKAGIKEIVTTTLHIEQKVGSIYIKKFGGIHKFFKWDRPILTDSGGWQVFSLINSPKSNGKNKLTNAGCTFVDPSTGKTSLLTPENSIQIQLNLGSDILTVLDIPIDPTISLEERKKATTLNSLWAQRAKKYFDQNKLPGQLLGAVIQGGDDFELRKQSAKDLAELDFDLYNFGGIPLYSEVSWKYDYPQGLYREMLHFVKSLIPDDKISYAMGVGMPDDIAYCVDIGWDLFDTVLPTRNARHGFLFVSEGQGDATRSYKSPFDDSKLSKKSFSYDILHLRNKRYEFDENPVDVNCTCECCKSVSRAYLRYLIRIKEPAGFRLATIHNLTFYANWVNKLMISISN
ncbi:MAG: queuine tRNA-ribosyltransferase [Candidatus Dojkabacteria bacterium]|nr:MAG: queuine tRNA-ribosyltransferase [Candidatus Dojkabacteria bacterium]